MSAEAVKREKEKHPEAKFLVHPECTGDLLKLADYIGSTSGIIDFAAEDDGKEYIIGTESGVLYELKKQNPDKTFYTLTENQICTDMKLITPEKVLQVLKEEINEVKVPEKVRIQAGAPLEKMLMLGPVLERMHNEILDPLIEMTFSRMVEAGIVPPPPDELQGMELNVEFVSMLAQAQRAIATNSVDRFVGNLGAVAGIKPEVLDKFDADRWADAYADMLGIDPELIVPGDQVALIRQQRAEAAKAQQQAALLNQGADTAQKLGSVDTSKQSALTDVTRAFSGYT